ncbi:MAG: hypothetical protein ACLVEJ_24915 [Parabacteroides sp.]
MFRRLFNSIITADVLWTDHDERNRRCSGIEPYKWCFTLTGVPASCPKDKPSTEDSIAMLKLQDEIRRKRRTVEILTTSTTRSGQLARLSS